MRLNKKILFNKYLLTLLGFIVYMLFFDRNDLFTQYERKKELRTLKENKAFYENEIEKTRKELSSLKNNPAALEKYAREHYYMKRDGEDIFIVEQDSVKNKRVL